MDEFLSSFGLPDVSSRVLPMEGSLDRISVREFLRETHIGNATSGEADAVTVRFNIVLEVVHSAASETDAMEHVLSYRTIVDAIDSVLEKGPFPLIEALAEGVARACLADARAVQVRVQVEKLGGEMGAAGVEIKRRRAIPEPRRLMNVRQAPPELRAGPRPFVAYLPASTLSGLRGNDWCNALAEWTYPCVICVAPLVPQPSPASNAQLRIGLLAVEQAAWALTDHDPRFQVATTRAEIEWALASGIKPIWAPDDMLAGAKAADLPDASDPAGLAAWLAQEIGGELLLLGEAEFGDDEDEIDCHARAPEELVRLAAAG